MKPSVNYCKRPIGCVAMAIALVMSLSTCPTSYAQELEARIQFIKEINEFFFDSSDPVETDVKGSYRGVVVTQQSIPDFQMSGSASGDDSEGSFMLAIASIDWPIEVEDGVAVKAKQSLPAAWKSILYSCDTTTEPANGGLGLADRLWPMMEASKGGKAVGIESHPTAIYKKYKYFEELAEISNEALKGQHGLWRLGPLNRFSRVEVANRENFREWQLYGWKEEVEFNKAYAELKRPSVFRLREQFSRLKQYGRYTSAPFMKTWLYPAPDTWNRMDCWHTLTSRCHGGKDTVRFQVARVRVIRPWFNIDNLIENVEKIDRTWKEGSRISDGFVPSELNYPKGELANYVEELVLVRRVEFGKLGLDSSHPLNFSYPVINLLGYVVRTVPRIE